MNPLPHDPNALDDALNRLLAGEQIDPAAVANNPLLEAAARLNAAPRPSLSPAAAARIRAAVLTAQAAQPAASSTPVQRYFPQSAPVRLALVAALTTLLIAAALFATRSTIQFLNAPPTPYSIVTATLTATHTPLPSSTPTMTHTATLVLPSATAVPPLATTTSELPPSTTVPLVTTPAPSATPTSLPTTALPSPTQPSATPVPTTTATTLSPSATSTALPTTALPSPTQPSATPVPTTTATALPVTIILQGPVQAIDGSTITIFDLAVLLSPDDPLLARIQLGVVVRVEGNIAAGSLVITAVRVTLAEPEPPANVPANSGGTANQAEGEVWRDNGNCSNPPPDWAEANGWRRRCEGASNQGNSGGNDDDDGDDDDD